MRIGRFHIPFTADGGIVSKTPQRDAADNEPLRALGATGTINYRGYLKASDYNPDLYGWTAIDVWERMRRSDSAVREALWHIYAPILNARWTVQAPDEATDMEKEATAFIRAAFFEWMNEPFVQHIQNVLLYVCFGSAVFEPEFQIVERPLLVEQFEEEDADSETPAVTTDAGNPQPPEPKSSSPGATPDPQPPETPQPKLLPPRQFITWRKFGHRLPRTIWRWVTDENEELVSIQQQVPKTQPDGSQTWEIIEIPAERLLVFTNEKWGSEWTGISMLRSAYKPWVLKELIERIMGIAYERHGVGIPVVYVPRDREGDTDLIDELESTLQNLRSGEFSYIIFPGPKAQGNVMGYQFEIVGPPSGIPNFEPALQYLRSEIKGSVLARFSELGHAATGARATANVQAEVWYNALHAIARYIESQHDAVIRRLVDMNYPGMNRYPKLKSDGIEARNLLEYAQSISLLATAEMLVPDTQTRAWVRDSVDAPPENRAEAQARAQQETAQKNIELKSLQVETDPTQTARPRASKSSTST